MKPFGLINLGILPLLLEAMTPAYAQHDQREQESRRPNQEQEARPERQQPPANPERQQPPPSPGKQPAPPSPERQTQRPNPAGHVEPRRAQEPSPRGQPQPANPARREQGPRDRGQREARRPAQMQHEYEDQHKGTWPDRRAHDWQAEHRSWQQRGGYQGYRIPTARYRSAFGPSHSFRMFGFPLVVVGGFPRFQYGGLWFSVMDPWPEYWSDNWYGSDDLYVEFYGGGYYLRNRRHPLDRMALTVSVR